MLGFLGREFARIWSNRGHLSHFNALAILTVWSMGVLFVGSLLLLAFPALIPYCLAVCSVIMFQLLLLSIIAFLFALKCFEIDNA